MKILDRIFSLTDQRTNVRTEIFGGLTTFLTMSYIIFVQPAVLSVDLSRQPTGLDFGAVLLATCLASAATSIFMGLWAGYPIALAPGMGENFFFVSTIMALKSMGVEHAWQTALGIVFAAGVLFFVLSVLPVREAILNAISPSLRNGIAVGIGLFIAFIGLRNGGIIVGAPATFVTMNPDLASADCLIFLAGLFLTAALHARRIPGSILIGILISTFLAALFRKVALPFPIMGFPVIHEPAAFRMRLDLAHLAACLPFIFVFLFMQLMDTLGTLVGVAEQAGWMKGNRLPRVERAFVVDAAGTLAGACLGTSTVTCYIESAAGVEAGARTGLASVTTGVLFLAALFASPLIGMVANYPPITAPALVIVGAMMIQNVQKIQWARYDEAVPAFLTMIGIPLSYSIADGLALGFISYPVIKLLSGRAKEVNPFAFLVAAILTAYFLFVKPSLGKG